ncbi:beta-N-acetylhexosaminidase [Hyphobacterium marinum]|uniref:beta-N-acetylhexosaminidase n=1 Tax=Hyphobacterium marinum TaxID=3116574 RepID=A0ABU7M1H1_9PROT|nr:beta-N-acetylhexosaminidase [Hyphobacterium sp. Y6023]MEE2567620.1 beta-N-acetylhexosaminidase [Hyphobacterium sp. Y6023]
MSVSAAIYGLSGPELDANEKAFFRDAAPWGFILFARNVESPKQLARLCVALRDAVGRDAPVFIDQEGGRVQRLKPPTWRQAPPAGEFGALYARDREAGLEAVRLNHRLIAHELRASGIDADCAPCLDLQIDGADAIIGDRSYGTDPDVIAALGRAAMDGLHAGGVASVIKHIPGHGRADADSHLALPRVDTPRETLEATDFAPFRALNDAPMAMTAHVVYADIDPDDPATLSSEMIASVIRGSIGYDGLVMTDDLSMKALSGTLSSRAERALGAGCDMVLHCNGVRREMIELADIIPTLSGDPLRRADAAAAVRRTPETFDAKAGLARLEELMSAVS